MACQRLLLFTTAAAVLPLACACTSSQPATLAGMPPSPVKIALLQPVAIDETSTYMGTLKSRKSAVLQPRVAGVISKILVDVGQMVASGTPIVEIDPRKQQATTDSAIAAHRSSVDDRLNAEQMLYSLEATHISKQANLDFLKRQHERYDWLSKQGAVAKETADNYAMQMKTAEGDLRSIDAQIDAQKAALSKMDYLVKETAANAHEQQVQLAYYDIAAPFAGIVGDIPFKLGEYVDSTAKVTTVTENQPLEVYVSVPAEKGPALRNDMTVRLTDSSGQLFGDAKVFFISPVAADTQTILIKALYANSDGRLRSNQTVTAQVVWRRRQGLEIPTSSVAHISGQEFVFVAKGQAPGMVAQQKSVDLGDIIGNNYVVKTGLQAGEHLVVSGVQNLVDGAPIQPQS